MSRNSPPAADPDKEDLAPLLAWLTEKACQAANSEAPHAAGMLTWAAQVVGERVDEDAPAPPATDEVAKLVATLEREADAEEKRDRTAWITADELRRCAELLRQHYPDAAPAPAPSGYAYRYPDGIRFNWGQQVNGCRPSEALPYWFSPHAPEPPDVEANAIKALRRLRRWWGLSGAGYSAEIVQGITDWIDGGMVGPLPPFPPHALPLPEEEQP
jgi:hypothetical protein